MSIFIPYSVSDVIQTFSDWFNLSLTGLSGYEQLVITILANLYFFIFWGFIIYCVLKSLNWVYERLC